VVGLSLLVLVVIVVIAAAISSRSSSVRRLTFDQLQARDCLLGSGLGLNTYRPYRGGVTVVPCDQRHIAEVFFADNAWPRSLAFPGYYAIGIAASIRCESAFRAYDGIPVSESIFDYGQVTPITAADWASGDRSVTCIAYEPTTQYPAGAPVSYSIKGSQR